MGICRKKGDTQELIYLDRIISKLGGSVACMVKQALRKFSEFSSQGVRALSFYPLGLHLALGKAFIPAKVWPKGWVLVQWQCWYAIEWGGDRAVWIFGAFSPPYFWPFLASGFNYIDITAPHVRDAVLMRDLGLQLAQRQSVYPFGYPWPSFHALKSGNWKKAEWKSLDHQFSCINSS